MPTYESGVFDPPAPVIRAAVSGRSNVIHENVPMLIDTGADISFVPLDVAVGVGAEMLESTSIAQMFSAETSTFAQVRLTIEFLHFRINGEFVVAPSEYGVIGRNILNLLKVTLDGPREEWSV